MGTNGWELMNVAVQHLLTVNSEILARILFSNSNKRHICHAKILRLGHYLPTSVNDKVITLIPEGFIFMKLS